LTADPADPGDPANPGDPADLTNPPTAADVVLVVDVANVLGSRPDGWWRDRKGSAAGLLAAFGELPGAGTVGPDGVTLRIARIVAVLEGAARGAASPGGVDVVEAERDGDSTIVAVTEELVDESATATSADPMPHVLVVTADRGLRRRLPHSVRIAGPQWLNALIGR
jgi:hypothetical protein